MKGLSDTISRCRPLVIVEVLPVYDPSSAIGELRLAKQQGIEVLLRNWSYVLLRLVPPTSLVYIHTFGVHADLALTNYVAIPQERFEALEQRLKANDFSVQSAKHIAP